MCQSIYIPKHRFHSIPPNSMPCNKRESSEGCFGPWFVPLEQRQRKKSTQNGAQRKRQKSDTTTIYSAFLLAFVRNFINKNTNA